MILPCIELIELPDYLRIFQLFLTEIRSGQPKKSSSQGRIFFFVRTVRKLSSRTRDGTHSPCSGSMKSQLLDHQGSPEKSSSYLTSSYLPVTVTTVSNKSNLSSFDYSKLLLKTEVRRSIYSAPAVSFLLPTSMVKK